MTNIDWIQKQAKVYRNLALTGRYQAVVHLEDQEDERFWDYQLQQIAPGRYRYLYYSKNNNGNDTRGCEQCLHFRPYLNEHFFICIDSDLRLLKGETGLNARNHIAQTYTYSWENHLCEATHIDRRIKQLVPDTDFDFQEFLTSFSSIVYRPLLYLIRYASDSRLNLTWNISKFNACIPLQPKREELADNGRNYLSRVASAFENALTGLTEDPATDIESLTVNNAYLHIQGHQLYKLIMHIGTLICKGTGIAFKTEILDEGLHTTGYDEIEFLQKDLRLILNNQP